MTEPLPMKPGGRQPLRELTIDLRRIKPAVLKEVEARLGESLAEAGAKNRESELVWAFAYAHGRRIDPELTWEEAGEVQVTLIEAASPAGS